MIASLFTCAGVVRHVVFRHGLHMHTIGANLIRPCFLLKGSPKNYLLNGGFHRLYVANSWL